MKAVLARTTRGLPVGAYLETCDNSGAKKVQIISVKQHKTVRRRLSSAGAGDLVTVAVIKGKPDVRNKVMQGVIVRTKMPYRRPDGTHIKFEDNSIVILKDEKGNPKGTIFKGPIAKEATERWPGIAKLARIVV